MLTWSTAALLVHVHKASRGSDVQSSYKLRNIEISCMNHPPEKSSENGKGWGHKRGDLKRP